MQNQSSSEQLSLTTAFHTYFAVGDIGQTAIQGLQGLRYQDNTRDRAESQDDAAEVQANAEIDRIYLKTPDTLQASLWLHQPAVNCRADRCSSGGCRDADAA